MLGIDGAEGRAGIAGALGIEGIDGTAGMLGALGSCGIRGADGRDGSPKSRWMKVRRGGSTATGAELAGVPALEPEPGDGLLLSTARATTGASDCWS